MKKIIKLSNWDTTTAFSTQNVLDESHWFVVGLKRALTLLEIGTFSITYKSADLITLQTNSFGSFDIARPQKGQNVVPYLFYVNSEDKELWGGSGITAAYNNTNTQSNNSYMNHIRGLARWSASGGGSGLSGIAGGVLQLKFEDGTIKGISDSTGFYGYTSLYYAPAQIGIVLPDNYISNAAPLTAVSLKYTKMSIVNKSGTTATKMNFNGEYFNSIYICDKYYVGGLRSNDAKKFVFDGYLFDVDDATDIEVIETTV